MKEQNSAPVSVSMVKHLLLQESNYKPMHLLCKSHTVEALDRSNLAVLYQIEKEVQQRQTLEGINPALKSFFRGKKTTVEAGLLWHIL